MTDKALVVLSGGQDSTTCLYWAIDKFGVDRELDAETGLPITFVPGRNLIFLTFAAAMAYRNRIAHLVTGVPKASLRPKCEIHCS